MSHRSIASELANRSWWYAYEGGIASFVLSAIDVALWDVRGKQLGCSVSELIGGAVRRELPTIAATHAFVGDLDAEIERHGCYVTEDGYRGVKVGMGKPGATRLGYEVKRDALFVAGLREAMGDGAILAMDRGHAVTWTVAEAIERTRAFCEYDLTWIEEPLEPEDIEGFRRLRRQVGCLVGTGEREFTIRGYERLLRTGISDVVGYDPGRAGGITAGQHLVRLAESAKVWFNPHAWSSAVTTAASLAARAVVDRVVGGVREEQGQLCLVGDTLAAWASWNSVPEDKMAVGSTPATGAAPPRPRCR
jgi:L-alanine-DL-glutamate epimerase-like enolase superfamily enzyme